MEAKYFKYLLLFVKTPVHLVFELHLFWPSAHATLKKGLKKLRVTSPRNPTSHFPMFSPRNVPLFLERTRVFFRWTAVSQKKKELCYIVKILRVNFNVSDWHDAFSDHQKAFPTLGELAIIGYTSIFCHHCESLSLLLSRKIAEKKRGKNADAVENHGRLRFQDPLMVDLSHQSPLGD